MEFNRDNTKKWMLTEIAFDDYSDNYRALAEECAAAFNVNDTGGPLDDPDHWIWDLPVEIFSE